MTSPFGFRFFSTRTAAIIAATLYIAGPVSLGAQPAVVAASAVVTPTYAPVPFTVGEELVFRATFGALPAGTARMRVDGVDTVRGRLAYHVVFAIDGGVPFFRVHDRYESWIDVETLSSLRHKQTISEGRYHRNTIYEFFPERAEYQKNDEDPRPSVSRRGRRSRISTMSASPGLR